MILRHAQLQCPLWTGSRMIFGNGASIQQIAGEMGSGFVCPTGGEFGRRFGDGRKAPSWIVCVVSVAACTVAISARGGDQRRKSDGTTTVRSRLGRPTREQNGLTERERQPPQLLITFPPMSVSEENVNGRGINVKRKLINLK